MADSENAPTSPPPSDSGAGRANRGGDSSRPDVIVFICPECERKLNGPARLQGKPGQCPHCGTKFIIPSYDQEPENEEIQVAQEEQTGENEAAFQGPPTGAENIEVYHESAEEYPEANEPPVEEPFFPPVEPDDLEESEVHPLARLFLTLWQEKEHGGLIEIHLNDGSTITPDWWAERLSVDSHAVFALQAPDGSYVMEAIPWDNIKRITVRRISELPGGVFE